jgi:hypothetical protein
MPSAIMLSVIILSVVMLTVAGTMKGNMSKRCVYTGEIYRVLFR